MSQLEQEGVSNNAKTSTPGSSTVYEFENLTSLGVTQANGKTEWVHATANSDIPKEATSTGNEHNPMGRHVILLPTTNQNYQSRNIWSPQAILSKPSTKRWTSTVTHRGHPTILHYYKDEEEDIFWAERISLKARNGGKCIAQFDVNGSLDLWMDKNARLAESAYSKHIGEGIELFRIPSEDIETFKHDAMDDSSALLSKWAEYRYESKPGSYQDQ